MKIYSMLIPLMLLLVVAGCQQNTGNQKGDQANQSREPLPPPPLPPEGTITLSDYGFGPIKKGTSFNKDSIKALLDLLGAYDLVASSLLLESGEFNIFEAHKGNKKVFEFYPDSKEEKVGSVHLFTNDYAGPDGRRVGMTYRAAQGEAMNCFPGMEAQSGKALCFKGGNTRVQYIFSHDFKGPDDELPPPNVLESTGVLDRIIWYAERK